MRHWFGIFASLALAGSVQAGSWADSLFTELSKDFASVPRGPMLSHPFHVKNNTNTPIHLHVSRVSCGCVSAKEVSNVVPPGEETAILATMDTTRFQGLKNVTIYVTIDQPQYEEVRLWVQANSRDDVTVAPDAINFGQVKRNTTPSASANITFLGSGQWQVQGATCESNYVRTTVKEIRRQAYDVTYQLTAQLRPDSPVGKWYTDIWVQTNNPATPRVRVPVNVEIESALSVSPPIVDLGQVKMGGQAQRKVMVRGVKPFRINEIKGADGQLSVVDMTNESRPVHVLAITLKPGSSGDLKRQLRVLTDLAEESEIEFQAKAQIMP
jgi:hypothetical protein